MDIATLIKFAAGQLDSGRASVRENNTIVLDYHGVPYTLLVESLSGLHPGKVTLEAPGKKIVWHGHQIPSNYGEGFIDLRNKARKIWIDHESKIFFGDPKR